eukprot:jgi/Bigna1/59979/fgenesh1_kg.8_\
MSRDSKAVDSSKDWEYREWICDAQFNIKKICEFLNNFDTTVRSRLSKVDAKLTMLERQLNVLEESLRNKAEDSEPEEQ